MSTTRDKLKLFCRLLATNGIMWTVLFVIYWILLWVLQLIAMILRSLERRCLLEGLSYPLGDYDFEDGGEHYTDSAKWEECIINSMMLRYVPQGSTVLEVGCGGGKWSEHLRSLASTLILTDVYDRSIAYVKERFGACEDLRYYVNSPGSLAEIQDNSIDAIWSFDVFVIVSPKCASDYAKEFRRVLKSGGVGLLNLMNDKPRLLIVDGYSS
jgi:ubiquinone/menaquinone biosynthesis C-methylase UbiE